MMKSTLFFLLALIAGTSALAQFKEGYFYTKDGAKVEGLLKFHYGGNFLTDKSDGDCSISYKPTRDAKVTRFTTKYVCCFVIESDSFAIVKNFRFSSFITYPVDFAQVIEPGKINLYRYYSNPQQQYAVGPRIDWGVERDGAAERFSKKQFKKKMPLYLSDYPALAEKVKKKQLRYENLQQIVNMYNEHFENQGSD